MPLCVPAAGGLWSAGEEVEVPVVCVDTLHCMKKCWHGVRCVPKPALVPTTSMITHTPHTLHNCTYHVQTHTTHHIYNKHAYTHSHIQTQCTEKR